MHIGKRVVLHLLCTLWVRLAALIDLGQYCPKLNMLKGHVPLCGYIYLICKNL